MRKFRIVWRRVKVKRKKGNALEYKKYKEAARNLADNRISYYNKLYGFAVNGVAIKNAKTRWGSCSKKGNLNFNYKIALLPEAMADYVIVHELCHLGEFNHSKKFWDLVGVAIPNHKLLRKKIQNIKL